MTKGPSGKGRDSLRGRRGGPFASPLVSNIIHATWYRSTEGVLNGSRQELYLDTTRASTIVVMAHNSIYALRVADPKNGAPLWVDEIVWTIREMPEDVLKDVWAEAVPRARMRNLTVEAIQLVTQTDRVVPPNLTWTCLPQSGSVRPPPRFSTSNAGVPLLRYKTVLYRKPRLTVQRTTRVGACGKHAAMCATVPSIVCERVVTKAGAWSSPEAVFADAMHRAKVLVVDSSHHMMYFTRFGEGEIQRMSGYPLDAFIQLAMQLAYYRVHGRTAPPYETTLRRSFSSGCTETIRATGIALVLPISVLRAHALPTCAAIAGPGTGSSRRLGTRCLLEEVNHHGHTTARRLNGNLDGLMYFLQILFSGKVGHGNWVWCSIPEWACGVSVSASVGKEMKGVIMLAILVMSPELLSQVAIVYKLPQNMSDWALLKAIDILHCKIMTSEKL
ncbi:Choline/Carnitine o-acyltransferase-domain-containing protein [Pisolithus tinctorius]|nr:Choline/Carnitine o-acyltransferase-domain-containing protein [Pisolithus tinctorius]